MYVKEETSQAKLPIKLIKAAKGSELQAKLCAHKQ